MLALAETALPHSACIAGIAAVTGGSSKHTAEFSGHLTGLYRETLRKSANNNQQYFVFLAMLLQVEDITEDKLEKLMQFAHQNNIQLSLMDDGGSSTHLPGKPLTPQQLGALIENSRKSGVISMQDAHALIRSHAH